MDSDPLLATYEWHFVERFPPKYLQAPQFISMFRTWIHEAALAREGFEDRLRRAALFAMATDDPDTIRRGLQCLASVGKLEDLALLDALSKHSDDNVSRDSKTCAFEIARNDPPADDAIPAGVAGP